MPLLNKDGYLVIYKAKNIQDEIKSAELSLKKNKAKVVDIIEYKLPLEEIYERNLVVIKHV